MGGKDSPLLCTSTSPQQSLPKSWLMTSDVEQKPLSPNTYVPKSMSSVNLDMKINRAPVHGHRHSSRSRRVPDWPCNTIAPSTPSKLPAKQLQQHELQEQQSSPTKSDGTVSPIRLYMESIEPRTLSYAIVGDSAVGKTSLLLSYTTGKISETHAPTIYDKFSCKT